MTLAEMLKKEGFTEDQIKAITGDPKVASTFEGMVAQAERDKAEGTRLKTEAEEKERKVNDWWKTEATGEINKWSSEVASAKARAAFLETQVAEAKKMGFIADPTPGTTATSTTAATTTTHVSGSPEYVTKDEFGKQASGVVTSFYITQDISNEYLSLFGKPLLGLNDLVKEAQANRMGLREHVEKKFNFQGKRDEISAAAKKAEEDAIRKDEREKATREFSEKHGSNPDMRQPVVSQFAKFSKNEQGGRDKQAWAKPDKRTALMDSLRSKAVKELVQ